MRNIDKEIETFISSISNLWKDEALDGDDTEKIATQVLAELNWLNGNITSEEYCQEIEKINQLVDMPCFIAKKGNIKEVSQKHFFKAVKNK